MKKILIKAFLGVNIIIWLYLAVTSFIFSWKNVELSDEHLYLSRDSILANIIGVAAVLFVIFLLQRKRTIIEKLNTRIIAILLSAAAVALSVYWVLNSGTAPQADARAVCLAASHINAGDYSDLARGEYVAVYPQQLGLITLMRIIFSLFGDMNFVAYQILSAISVFAIVYSSYEIASTLSHEDKLVELIATVAGFLCIPMYAYTAFVYGEILSTALLMIAINMFLKAYGEFTISRAVIVVITLTAAMLVRKNTVIIVIAMLGVIGFNLIFGDKKKITAAIAVAVILGLMSQSLLIKGLYNKHWDEDVTHLPALLWVAMGTNDDYGYAGWYNGSGTQIFWDNELDVDSSKADAIEVIKNFAGVCKSNPKYAVNFYFRKVGAQWSAPMYQSIVMNNNIEGKQSDVVDAIFHNEKVWEVLDAYMNLYQLIIYIGLLGLLICFYNKDCDFENYLGVIVVFGGFLFSVIWEAKARYVFPYLIIMLPYAAYGAVTLIKSIDRRQYK